MLEFRLETSGTLEGSFDAARLQQVFSNLLANAVQHGARRSPVILEAHGTSEAVFVLVKNQGPPIPPEALQVIFNPLVQIPAGAGGAPERQSPSGDKCWVCRRTDRPCTAYVRCADEHGRELRGRLEARFA